MDRDPLRLGLATAVYFIAAGKAARLLRFEPPSRT
jgi:hypothetical protein